METELNSQAVPKSIADTWTLENEGFDKDTLLACIVQTGGQFEPLYTNPEYFRMMSGYWWKRWTRTFTKWFDAFDIEYDPLENYDRHEQWHEDTFDDGSESTETNVETVVDDDATGRVDTTDKNTQSGTDKTEHDYEASKDVENEISAFDSGSYQPHDQSHVDDDVTVDDTTVTYGKVDTRVIASTTGSTDDSTTTSEGTSATDKTNDRDFDHEGRIHGNIGVVSSQQMLKQELDIQAWNIYQHIADIFCKEMLIQVY